MTSPKQQRGARGGTAKRLLAGVASRFFFDDLAPLLASLAPEITAQPNFRTVRVDTLGRAGPRRRRPVEA